MTGLSNLGRSVSGGPERRAHLKALAAARRRLEAAGEMSESAMVSNGPLAVQSRRCEPEERLGEALKERRLYKRALVRLHFTASGGGSKFQVFVADGAMEPMTWNSPKMPSPECSRHANPGGGAELFDLSQFTVVAAV